MVDELLDVGGPRPRFGAEVATALRRRIEEALGPVAETAAGGTLRVGKHDLGAVHACEAHWQSEQGSFVWGPRTAYGSIAHRALRLSITGRGRPIPLDLVDMAVDAYEAESRGGDLGAYLRRAPEAEVAELRAQANDVVVQFLECFPPLLREWRPRTDTPLLVNLCGGRISLRGKPDLAFGQSVGSQAGVVIVDLKTGGAYAHHLDDLRFYALLQTLRIGVPPHRVASYYLDSASFEAEDVTVGALEAAADRVVTGVTAIARLLDGRVAAAIRPGPTCRWCRRRDDCEGPAQLEGR